GAPLAPADHERTSRERDRCCGPHQKRYPSARSRQGEEYHGPREVELLFDGKRPSVQQRLEVGLSTEISRLAVEEVVGIEQGRACETPPEACHAAWEHDQAGQKRARCVDAHECRYDAPGAPEVEGQESKMSVGIIVGNQARDQITRDHEEDVDTDEPARKSGNLRMKQHNCEHSNRTQSIDVLAILHSKKAPVAAREGVVAS